MNIYPPAKFDDNRVHPWIVVAAHVFRVPPTNMMSNRTWGAALSHRWSLFAKKRYHCSFTILYIKIICCLFLELPGANCQGPYPAFLPSFFLPSFSATGSLSTPPTPEPDQAATTSKYQICPVFPAAVHPRFPDLSCRTDPS